MDRVWTPQVIEDLKETDFSLYLDFSKSACIKGGGGNLDRALQVLYQADGDIKRAVEGLLTENNKLTSWTKDEVHQFEQLFRLYGKKFNLISENIKTKSIKDCVNFYYRWKRSKSRNTTLSNNNHHNYNNNNSNSRTPIGYTTSISSTASTTTTTSITPPSTTTTPTTSPSMVENRSPLSLDEQFPCKVCGRIFEKIKSRSAHMKKHKNER